MFDLKAVAIAYKKVIPTGDVNHLFVILGIGIGTSSIGYQEKQKGDAAGDPMVINWLVLFSVPYSVLCCLGRSMHSWRRNRHEEGTGRDAATYENVVPKSMATTMG